MSEDKLGGEGNISFQAPLLAIINPLVDFYCSPLDVHTALPFHAFDFYRFVFEYFKCVDYFGEAVFNIYL